MTLFETQQGGIVLRKGKGDLICRVMPLIIEKYQKIEKGFLGKNIDRFPP
jgi:hypothetical protein